MNMSMNTQRLTVSLPNYVYDQLMAIYNRGEISRFVSGAVEKEIIANNCLYYKEIDGVHVPFEELYVWEIGKSELLKKLENLRIENITFFTKGKRGYLYKGKYKEMYKCKPEQVDKKIKCKDKKDRDKKKCKYNKCNCNCN